MTQNDFNDLNDLLTENKNATIFIKDYILRFRFADIAIHSTPNSGMDVRTLCDNTTTKVVGDYRREANKIINGYNKEIQKICSKENIENYCNNNKLKELKSELDKSKSTAFEKIISLYNGIESFEQTSGRLSDFMLYDQYLSYITSDEFVYDDDNPYVVELLDNITNFIATRSKLEFMNSNLNSLLIKFENLCNSTIRKYWKPAGKDYYGHIKNIFKYDFYANNEKELIEAAINDENKTTLYSKIVQYLKNVTTYIEPQNTSEKYKNMDVNQIMSGATVAKTTSEEDNEVKLQNIRKIAFNFVYLRKIETSSSKKAIEDTIPTDNNDDLFSLVEKLNTMNMSLADYNKACSINETLINYSRVVDKLTGSLKSVTENESRILRKLSDKAINWYLKNHQAIDSEEIFKKYKEINWPSPSQIKYKGKKHDFFYIEDPEEKNLSVQQNDSSRAENLLANYNFSEDSLITEYGIDSYEYWLKYFTMATLVNCAFPMFWSTGLIASGLPVLLPIIFVPIIVISGRVILVIGLGICGICPLPLLYFVNVGDMPGFLIPPLNAAVDMLKMIPAKILATGSQSTKEMIRRLIKENDDKITQKNEELKTIDETIILLKTKVKEDKEVLRAMKKKKKKDSTTNAKKREK